MSEEVGLSVSTISLIEQGKSTTVESLIRIMKIKKTIFDITFIVVATLILILLDQYGLLEKYLGFALIPILIAYFLGQYSGRKFVRENPKT